MRLIHVHSMKMEEHFGDGSRLPKYAILSHTWVKEEVSFQAYQLPTCSDMKGYKKIQYACEQAKRDGLDYAWIDTCCIDKTSSTELSEAINSMFNWYRWAQVCYVYLEDAVDEYLDSKFSGFSFQWSRWFKRGWTLQELLAPTNILFYGKSWRYIGSKQSLGHTIAKTTGIPLLALQRPEYISVYSIATRMSWAASRSTTRTEDMAYCLLGIFGVSMPLLYGEGEKAFIRLQEELIKISDDETLFAWWINDGVEGILASSPRLFQHRGDILVSRFGRLGLRDSPYFLDQDQQPAAPKQLPQKGPYSMTKMGLRVDLPLIPKRDFSSRIRHYVLRELPAEPDALGVLQCCNSSDPLGSYIAIPLLETTTPGIYSRSRSGHISISGEELSGTQVHSVYIQGSQPRSQFPIYWCEIATSGSISYNIVPIHNRSFTFWDANTLRAEANILLPKQTKVTMEFNCTISRTDRCFHLILELDLITNQQTITIRAKPEQVEICTWMERYRKLQRDLYGENRDVPEAPAKKQDVDTVCWWHKPTASMMVLCCYYIDPYRVILKSEILDKSSPHFETLKKKAGRPAFSRNNGLPFETIY